MRRLVASLLSLLAAAMVAACGGGGSGAPSPTDGDGSAPTPWIRYQGLWNPTRYSSVGTSPPATLTLRALPGQSGISSNALARIEVQLGASAPVVLTAPNSTDARWT